MFGDFRPDPELSFSTGPLAGWTQDKPSRACEWEAGGACGEWDLRSRPLSPSHWLPRPLTLIFHVPWAQAPSWALSVMRSECVGRAAPAHPTPGTCLEVTCPQLAWPATPCQGPALLTGHTRWCPAWRPMVCDGRSGGQRGGRDQGNGPVMWGGRHVQSQGLFFPCAHKAKAVHICAQPSASN